MSELESATAVITTSPKITVPSATIGSVRTGDRDSSQLVSVESSEAARAHPVSKQKIDEAIADFEAVIEKTGLDLAFEVDDDLQRVVVSLSDQGSGEIVRQFPPEEFISVAKFIASHSDPGPNKDDLVGLLFDQRA